MRTISHDKIRKFELNAASKRKKMAGASEALRIGPRMHAKHDGYNDDSEIPV